MAAGTYKGHAITPFDDSIIMRGPREHKEAASQTFKKGAPVLRTAAGFISVYAGAGSVYGIAAEDAHNTSGDGDKSIKIWRPLPGERFLVVYQDALDQTDIGDTFGLVADASGVWYLDEADASDEMVVDGFPEGGPNGTNIGDTIKYCLASFLQTTLQEF